MYTVVSELSRGLPYRACLTKSYVCLSVSPVSGPLALRLMLSGTIRLFIRAKGETVS